MSIVPRGLMIFSIPVVPSSALILRFAIENRLSYSIAKNARFYKGIFAFSRRFAPVFSHMRQTPRPVNGLGGTNPCADVPKPQ